MDPVIGPTFSKRRLGNVGVGIFWRHQHRRHGGGLHVDDLHVWLPKNMLMCERLCTLAGVFRSTMWDDNTAVMMFYLQQPEALKRGMILNLSRNSSITDDAKYEGGFVVSP